MAEARNLDERRRRQKLWTWAGLGAVLLSVLLTIFLWNPLVPGGERPRIGRVEVSSARFYDPSQPATAVRTQDTGTALMPMGRPLDLPEEEMVAVTITKEGYVVFAHNTAGEEVTPAYPYGGGGGGEIAGRGQEAVPGAPGPLYLKTAEGQYVALVQL